MAIFLRHSWNVKPLRWGNPADVQYAIRVNSEKIYNVDPDSIVLAMPLFWGLPPLDYSGNNNHGTNHGATYKDGSLDFDGNNDYIDLGQSFGQEIDDYTSITVLSWVKIDTLVGDQEIVARTPGVGDAFELRYDEGEKYWYFVTRDTGLRKARYSQEQVATNQWYHVTGRWNGTLITVYVNGILGAISDNCNDLITRTESLNIGRTSCGFRHLNGMVSEVHISKSAYTKDQIALFYDLPWALYQPVSRPVYFFQAAVGGISIPVTMQNMRGGFNPIGMRGGFINAD